nr:DUF11 domain-containing protein [Pseudomarimonas arenosa]
MITCVTDQYTVGGSVSGLADGNSVVLQNNGGDDLEIAANGSFNFATPLDDGANYLVTVVRQPGNPSQNCSVVGGSGSLAGSPVTNIQVDCVNDSLDLTVSITDGMVAVQPGDLITYMIEIRNLGPTNAQNVVVQSALSLALSDVEWECLPGTGAACPASGVGEIDTLVDLDAGASVAFVLTAQTNADFLGAVESSITANAPGLTELNPDDNTATDISATDLVFRDDFELPAGDVKAWLERVVLE